MGGRPTGDDVGPPNPVKTKGLYIVTKLGTPRGEVAPEVTVVGAEKGGDSVAVCAIEGEDPPAKEPILHIDKPNNSRPKEESHNVCNPGFVTYKPG